MSTKSTRPTGNVSRPDQDFWVVLARAGLGCLGWCMRSVQLHLASRGRSEGTGAGPGLTAPHSHTHGTSTRDVLSIHDLEFRWKVSQSSCGAGLVCDWRQEACHRVCMCPPCQRCQHCHVPCFETRQHEDRTRGHTPPAPGSSGEAGPGKLGESYL